MTAHTPGPWIINADSADARRGRRERMPKGYASIDSETPVGPCMAFYGLALITVADEDGEPIDEGFANATLIAAAPDQHAAGIEIDRIFLVIESAVRNCDPGHHAAVLAALKANRAAVCKATGAAS